MSRLWIVAAAVLFALAPVGEARAQGRSTGAVTLGAIGGGALGFIAGVLALNALVDDGRTKHKGLTF